MIGVERLVGARLRGHNPDSVRINVEPPPALRYDTLYRAHDGRSVAELWIDPSEIVGALDLRCCRGLAVFVHAPSYEAGKAALFRVQEFDPSAAFLIADDSVVLVTDRGMEQWDL